MEAQRPLRPMTRHTKRKKERPLYFAEAVVAPWQTSNGEFKLEYEPTATHDRQFDSGG